jgi:hypothetical protein
LDGSTREIFAKDLAVRWKYRATKHGFRASTDSGNPALLSVDLVGDRALIQSLASESYFVRDLASGTLTGPFSTPSRGNFNFATMSSSGAVAFESFKFTKRSGVTRASGVFPNPLDPATFAAYQPDTGLMFCGRHLLAVPFDNGKLQELDPVTFAPVRTVVPRFPSGTILFGIEVSCDDDFMYGADLRSDDVDLLAYPLN